jgi:hypothetical protein
LFSMSRDIVKALHMFMEPETNRAKSGSRG